mgnify:CR=1 FL=1
MLLEGEQAFLAAPRADVGRVGHSHGVAARLLGSTPDEAPQAHVGERAGDVGEHLDLGGHVPLLPAARALRLGPNVPLSPPTRVFP